jgi:hypothetical protein
MCSSTERFCGRGRLQAPPGTLAAVATVALLTVAASSAQASLVLISPQNFQGTGLGSVNTILTLGSPDSTSFESGSVGVNAGTNAQVISGDAKTGASQTQVRTLSELGVGSASALRVVFNALEPGGDAIRLDNLVLTIYGTNGSVLFTSGAFTPVNFADTFTGAGNSGFVFGLDATQASAAQAAAFGANFGANRVGLSATASNATGGFETFFVASAAAVVPSVPEPSSWALLLGAGLAGGVMLRRRSQRS